MMTPEGRVKAKLKKFLSEREAWFFMPVQMGYGRKTVDFLGCYRGRMFAIETKREGGVATNLQQLELDRVIRAGGLAWVEASEGLETTREMFNAIE